MGRGVSYCEWDQGFGGVGLGELDKGWSCEGEPPGGGGRRREEAHRIEGAGAYRNQHSSNRRRAMVVAVMKRMLCER